jgi:uncharacterized membrane protein
VTLCSATSCRRISSSAHHSLSHIVYPLQGHSVDLNPPLFFVLAWFVERFGDGPQAIRLVSVLAGTAAIPLTYLADQ